MDLRRCSIALAMGFHRSRDGLPSGYRAVGYLSTINATTAPWIDLNYTIDNNGDDVQMYVSSRLHAFTTSDFGLVGGYRSLAGNNTWSSRYFIGGTKSVRAYSFGVGNSLIRSIPLEYDEWVDLKMDVKDLGINVYKNGAIADHAAYADGEVSGGIRIGLFCWLNNYDNLPSPSARFNGDIRSFRFWKSGVLVRDMVPCIRESDSKPGMYDLCRSVSAKTGTPFYTSENTVNFAYGD